MGAAPVTVCLATLFWLGVSEDHPLLTSLAAQGTPLEAKACTRPSFCILRVDYDVLCLARITWEIIICGDDW